MTNKTPRVAKNRREKNQINHGQELANGQIVFFLSSDGLAQRFLNLSRWFTHETTAFSNEQRTSIIFVIMHVLAIDIITEKNDLRTGIL